jgi:hypothetical protein
MKIIRHTGEDEFGVEYVAPDGAWNFLRLVSTRILPLAGQRSATFRSLRRAKANGGAISIRAEKRLERRASANQKISKGIQQSAQH